MSVGNDEESAGIVIRFAAVFVGKVQFVSFDAAAQVRLLQVGADLGAESGRITLVDVLAGEAIGLEFLPVGTETERSGRSLFTVV